MNKKGFTLIELLAVIIILGILMIIAIPSVTKYISDSRESAYIDTAKEIIGGARNIVNGGKLEMYSTNTTYYIPTSCIKTENAQKSPYGDFTQAYVGVIYDGKGYQYYWISVDDAGQGVKNITRIDKLDTDSIESDLKISDITDVVETAGIGNRTEINILKCSNNTWDSIILSNTNNNVSEEGGSAGSLNGTIDINSYAILPAGKTKKSDLEVGDLIKIGTEEFYVISYNTSNDNLTLLARYNLKVGDIYDGNGSKVGSYSEQDEGYGRQSSESKAYVASGQYRYGTIAFSNTYYWYGKEGPGKEYEWESSEYNYSFVFDNNSILYPYVKNYETYLTSLGAHIKESRLLKYTEMRDLGCSLSMCPSNVDFIKGTSYWFGTASVDGWIFSLLYGLPQNIIHNNSAIYGVRPVLVI